MMYTLYDAEAHIEDLRRRADQERLAHQSRSQPTIIIVTEVSDRLGQALIWLGSRLHEPVCEPVKPSVSSGTTATLSGTFSLNQAACC